MVRSAGSEERSRRGLRGYRNEGVSEGQMRVEDKG